MAAVVTLPLSMGLGAEECRLLGRELEQRTYAPGETVFGEMALFDREVRSATVVADGELECYVLTRVARPIECAPAPHLFDRIPR